MCVRVPRIALGRRSSSTGPNFREHVHAPDAAVGRGPVRSVHLHANDGACADVTDPTINKLCFATNPM